MPRIFNICYPESEDFAVIDPSDIVLNLPHPKVSRSSRRIVTTIFGMDYQVTILINAHVS